MQIWWSLIRYIVVVKGMLGAAVESVCFVFPHGDVVCQYSSLSHLPTFLQRIVEMWIGVFMDPAVGHVWCLPGFISSVIPGEVSDAWYFILIHSLAHISNWSNDFSFRMEICINPDICIYIYIYIYTYTL